MGKIRRLDALEILDSRGNPTIQVAVHLDSGVTGVAKVPSGASTGKREAVELRDGDAKRYGGKGVRNAVANVVGELQQALTGFEGDQTALDIKLISLDGTPNKGRLGANALLGVSVGFAKACATENGIPLYRHLFSREDYLLPVPAFNVLNGGRHADNNVDLQEFMIAPIGAPSFGEGLRAGSEVFHSLKETLKSRGYDTSVGDEGGFAPRLKSNEEAMEVLRAAIGKAGYTAGKDIAVNLDPAASEFYDGGSYVFEKSDHSKRTSEALISLWEDWLNRYPEIYSLEDGLAEGDWGGWRRMTERLGGRIQLVGDDIFVTNTQILQQGIRKCVANSILIKLNQIGTMTETLACMELARRNGYTTVVSHRSGETDDSTIADFAVASGAGQIKSGSVCRGERIAKYNRLLEIEKELGSNGHYAGRTVYERWRGVSASTR
jgi:enolase 1/2/3